MWFVMLVFSSGVGVVVCGVGVECWKLAGV